MQYVTHLGEHLADAHLRFVHLPRPHTGGRMKVTDAAQQVNPTRVADVTHIIDTIGITVMAGTVVVGVMGVVEFGVGQQRRHHHPRLSPESGAEAVQVHVVPAHGLADDVVKLVEPQIRGHLDTAPHRRERMLEIDMQAKHHRAVANTPQIGPAGSLMRFGPLGTVGDETHSAQQLGYP